MPRVITSYVAAYPDPLVVRAGERVVPGRRDDEFPGWTWCVDPRGKGGWTPEAFLADAGDGWVCTRDYDSHELTVAAGEVVEVVERHAGWACCRSGARVGWLPESHLEADGQPGGGPPQGAA